MKHLSTIILFLWVSAMGGSYAQVSYKIKPSATDTAIKIFDDPHFIYYRDKISPKNRLFVLFPGTNGLPQYYQLLLEEAAQMGYHTIGLTFANSTSVNEICSASTDTSCHRRARLEILDGIDRHDNISVSPPNGIYNRLTRLIKYLAEKAPSENWSQYLNQKGEIIWEKIIVAGHSEGGGQAGIIGKFKKVDKVLLLAATDWMEALKRPADWLSLKGATPAERYFAFSHYEDEILPISTQIAGWKALGIEKLAPLINIDEGGQNFQGSHTLVTYAKPDFSLNSPAKHNAPAVSIYTPKDNKGAPLFKQVWNYLISGKSLTTAGEGRLEFQKAMVYPNPALNFLRIDNAQAMQSWKILTTQGNLVLQGTSTQIDISGLTPAVYVLLLQGKKGMQGLRFIKN